jgi:hypothetical protein
MRFELRGFHGRVLVEQADHNDPIADAQEIARQSGHDNAALVFAMGVGYAAWGIGQRDNDRSQELSVTHLVFIETKAHEREWANRFALANL